MRIGQLDRRVSLESRVDQFDSTTNELIPAWAPIATVPAAKRDQGGREFLSAGTVIAEGRTLFTIRWRDDVSTIDRLICDGIAFNIVNVAELGRRQWLQLQCEVRS